MAASGGLSASGRGAPAPLLGNASALDPSPSLGELRAYHRASDEGWFRSALARTLGSLLLAGAFLVGAFLVQPYLGTAPTVVRWIAAGAPLYWAVLSIVGLGWWLRWRLRDVRIWRFARLNGLGFAHRVESGSETWRTARDGQGFPSNMRNIEEATFGRADEVILGRNRVMPSRNSERANLRKPFGFARLDLPSQVPHIILKNRRARILPLTGLSLGNRTKLSLEGDFDRHFTLLCPDGYERDALEIFTPDVMAAVIDVAGRMEVELVEDHLYLYFPFATRLWQAETLQRMQSLLELLRDRFDRQTRGYRDDRASLGQTTAGEIGLTGRRMTDRNGVSAASVMFTVAVVSVSGIITALSLFVLPNL